MAISVATTNPNTGINKIDAILEFIRNNGGNITNWTVSAHYQGRNTVSLEFVLHPDYRQLPAYVSAEDQELLRYVPEEAMGHNREICACHNCLEFRTRRVDRINQIERLSALGAPLSKDEVRDYLGIGKPEVPQEPVPEPSPVRRIVHLEDE